MSVDPPPPLSHRRGRRGWHLPMLVAFLLWLVISALGIVALLRLVAWDSFQPFAVLNDLTALVYLPAWVVLLVAAIGRRPLLVGAALLIVIAQIAFLSPELLAAQSVPAWAQHGPTLRLLDANVSSGNPSMADYAREIAAARPQLLTMEEASPGDGAQLARSGSLAGLPYRFEVDRFDSWAFFVASRYRLSGTRVVSLYGRPLIVETTLEVPSGPLPLWVVHTIAPQPASFSEWQGQLALVNTLLRSRGPSGLLILGDFNATWGSRGFRSLLDLGVDDGAAVRGRAFDMTWSQTMSVLPPLVRIDHVLTGPGLAVTQIRTEPGVGSDHRALEATVALHR